MTDDKNRNHIKWLFKKIENRVKKLILVLIFLSFLYNATSPAYALLYKYLVDSASSGETDLIRLYILFFLVFILVQSLLSAVIRRITEIETIEIDNNLKKSLLNEVFDRNYRYISEIHSGEWMNKFTSDISIIARNAVGILPNIISITMQIVSALIVLIVIEPVFVGMMLVAMISVIVFEVFFYRGIKKLHKDVQEKDGSLRSYIQECLNSIIVIKSYAKEEKSITDLNGFLENYKKSRLKRNLFSVIMNFFFGTGINGALILCAAYCAYGILNKQISYGTFVAIIQIVSSIRTPLTSAYSIMPNYYSMIGSIERIRQIEEFSIDKIDVKKDVFDFYKKRLKSIIFDGVSFEYRDDRNENQIISDLNLRIDKGTITGVIGPSGCGKSTLFKLLLCLYSPMKGRIYFDSIENVETILNSSFRKLFAYVPQDNQLLRGTIRDVICFGETYDEGKMNNALFISCSNDFISKLPDGVDYVLKESGSGLSEGEMQRIAIARAIYSDHPVLLLDEATSSLNEELELQIMDNLMKMTDKTVLIITHHKNILRYFDQTIECKEKESGYIWKIKKKQKTQ